MSIQSKNFNKSDLAIHMARKLPLLGDDTVNDCIDLIMDEIIKSVALDQALEIRGFGVFSKKFIRPRKFSNPKTNKIQFLGETAVLHFKPSTSLLKF
jgi:integration host factor subunit beta